VSDIARSLYWGECGSAPAEAGPTASLEPGFSVAVCTYRRPQSLIRLLDSVAAQEKPPRQLVIVDASPDDTTERAVTAWASERASTHCLLYFRVTGGLRGLTRQRNFALTHVHTDLVAFFDDDIVLQPGCLGAMEAAHRTQPDVVGVGAVITNSDPHPDALWRVRRLLLLVPSLEAGRYFASGVSTPWWTGRLGMEGMAEGDWLPGGATMWRTKAARDTGFVEDFSGYCSGEDLEFSLRVAGRGRLVMAGGARVEHLHEPGGRPDEAALGYAVVRNHHRIHAATWGAHSRRAELWFVYAIVAEGLLQAIHLLRPGHVRETWSYLRGVARYGVECLTGAQARG
jgi:GT2 family glycosyltransferase